MSHHGTKQAMAGSSASVADLKRGMGIWVWTKRPARVVESHGDGSYEVAYVGDPEAPSSRVRRNDLDPMVGEERKEYLQKPRLELDAQAAGHHSRPPLRKFMDEWPLSRAEMIRVLKFSPPKVDRLLTQLQVPLDVAVMVAVVFEVEIDPAVLPLEDRDYLEEALVAAREGARSAPVRRGRQKK